MKKILEFLSENFQFLVVKFSVYLNRRVFLMLFAQACLSEVRENGVHLIHWYQVFCCRGSRFLNSLLKVFINI